MKNSFTVVEEPIKPPAPFSLWRFLNVMGGALLTLALCLAVCFFALVVFLF